MPVKKPLSDKMNETEVGIYDAKTRLASLVTAVENGQSITITRHGKPVARLVSVEGNERDKNRREAIERLRNAFKGNRLEGLSIREMIDEGRH